MRILFLLAVLNLAALFTASAAAETLTAAEAYQLPQPAPDAVIRYGHAPRQVGYLRLPDGEGPFAVAVIVHGGCWLDAYDGSYMASLAEAVTEAGIAAWSIGFRRVGEEGGGWPLTFLDAASGLDHVVELARHYPLDPERVLTIGHSAGGHLALWLAARPNLPPDSPLYADKPQPVHAVLALAAAADLDYLSAEGTCGDAATLLVGGTPDEYPERFAVASPLHLLPLKMPQILINGELDTTWSPPAENYHSAARAAGDPVQLRVMPGAGHFELVAPDAAGFDVVRSALDELHRAIERSASG